MNANSDILCGSGKAFILAIVSIVFTLSCVSLGIPPKESTPAFPDDPRVDRSFLTGEPCEAPCWYGLRIGVAGIEDVRATLKNLPLVDQATLSEYAYAPNDIYFRFKCVYYHPVDGDCGAMRTSVEGRLASIDLSIQYPLELSTAIQRLGDPGYYSYGPSPNEDICMITVFWPAKSILAFIDGSPKDEVCDRAREGDIDLTLQVGWLKYKTIIVEQLEDLHVPHWPSSSP